jgi:hypothetical protein
MAFHPGDRVELVATDDPSTHLRPGDRGTVTGVREVPEPTIDVQWDDGSTLSVLPGPGDHITTLLADHTSAHADPAAAPPTSRPPAGQPGIPAALTSQPATQQAAPPPTSRRSPPP